MPSKIVYGNDLMYKLRHMTPAPPAASSIPEGALSIFLLPNATGTTVHSVSVHKKEKKTVVPVAVPSTSAPGSTSHFAVASGPIPSETPAAFTPNAYAAAINAMSEAEREKLQEVRTAFLSRFNVLQAAETKRGGTNASTLQASTNSKPAASVVLPTTTAASLSPSTVEKSSVPKQWAPATAPVPTTNLADILAEPVSRNERRRQEEARVAAEKAAKAPKKMEKPQTEKRARPLEKFPTFMVDTSKNNKEQPFFVGPDGRQYPMPPNPFADLASHLQQGANAMDIADFYGWWTQQAAFFPEYYTVPVEVPVDSQGNILPVVTKQASTEPSTKKTRRGKRGGAGRHVASAADAPEAAPTPQKTKAAPHSTPAATPTKAAGVTPATEARPAADGATQPRTVGLGKGRTAPAVLTGESLETRHRQRERQIHLGKRTLGFLVYEKMRAANAEHSHQVPGSRAYVAGGDITEIPSDCHPPPHTQPCSKRSWDGQVRRWRNALHKLDRYAEQFLTPEEINRFPAQAPVQLSMDDDDDEVRVEEAKDDSISATA